MGCSSLYPLKVEQEHLVFSSSRYLEVTLFKAELHACDPARFLANHTARFMATLSCSLEP